MSKRDGSRRRVLSQDERVLWTTFTRAIAPLRAGAAAENEGEPETPAVPPPQPSRAETPAPAVAAPAQLTPLGRRLRRSVARGKEAIDAKLDLHGLTQAQAHAALLRFLRAASGRGARLVLVITGKGSGNLGARGDGAGERGVLKRQVPHWLSLPEFRSLVIGFEDAHVAHGGEGALYVRIRRSRM
jgi:DNA-nicking Smr family endonuclease